MVNDECVLQIKFMKDTKNKVRAFYKQYHDLMNKFFAYIEA